MFDQPRPSVAARSPGDGALPAREQSPARQATAINPGGAGKSCREIVFQLKEPSAGEVLLAGCFTNWDEAPISMRRDGAGHWQTKVLLPPGRYHYKFLVDGNWQDDPHAKERTPNPFGTFDSVPEMT